MTDPSAQFPASPDARPAGDVSMANLLLTAAVLAGILAATMIACSFVGRVQTNWGIWQVRMARAVAAAIVGAGLATAGVSMQSLLRNPLASPYILGVSSGAGVGVLVGLVLLGEAIGRTWANTPVLAAAGALATMGVVYLAAQRRGRLHPLSLLLTGVIVNAFNGALMLFLYVKLNPVGMYDYMSWAIGEFRDSLMLQPGLLAACGGVIGLGWLYLLGQAKAYNVQALGDDVASSSGVHLGSLRLGAFAAASLMTAAAVALVGPIGFVGLIVPHVGRIILGPDHRRLMVGAGFLGAIFLVLADTFCRLTNLPVGVVTAFCGGPFFLLLLRRKMAEVAG